MSLTPREFTIMGLIAIMVSVILAVTTGLYIQAGNSHDEVLQVVQSNAARLEALEAKKAPATAKRFTSDDAQDLIACLRLPKPEQRPCLDAIQSRFTGRTSTQM